MNDEQLLIKSEDKSVLFYLSNVTFHNPINIHDILTVTSIVCDDLKDSTNKKYLTENDIDVDIIKEIIKVLNDNKIQITCSQLHCDLITNTAFEPYALEKNHYTKTECDEKFNYTKVLEVADNIKLYFSYYRDDSSNEWIMFDCYQNDGYYFDLGYWAKSLNLTVDDILYCDSIYKLDRNTRFVTTEDVYTKTESDAKYVSKTELT